MAIKKALLMGLRILAVCLLFAICFAVGGALSGLARIGQQAASSQQALPPQASSQAAPETPPRAQPMQPPENFLPSFLTFSFCVGVVLSYLILRSHGHGWALVGAIALAMYGISTVVSQIESVAFLSNKLPPGMIGAIFLHGAISTALFAPLAVLVLGKWRAAPMVSGPAVPAPAAARVSVASAAWRLVLIVVAFVFLYMFFGYYVAWQNPALRQYYGGQEYHSFFAILKSNWLHARWIYPLAAFRALLYVVFLLPLLRLLKISRAETAVAVALFLAAWTTALLLPNPLMPASVAHSHFWETLGFSLVFGALAGWLLKPPPRPARTPA